MKTKPETGCFSLVLTAMLVLAAMKLIGILGSWWTVFTPLIAFAVILVITVIATIVVMTLK